MFNLNEKYFTISKRCGRNHQNKFLFTSPQGTIFPWELNDSFILSLPIVLIFTLLFAICLNEFSNFRPVSSTNQKSWPIRVVENLPLHGSLHFQSLIDNDYNLCCIFVAENFGQFQSFFRKIKLATLDARSWQVLESAFKS